MTKKREEEKTESSRRTHAVKNLLTLRRRVQGLMHVPYTTPTIGQQETWESRVWWLEENAPDTWQKVLTQEAELGTIACKFISGEVAREAFYDALRLTESAWREASGI